MSRIKPSETLAVRERILAATRDGRLQDWNERIGEIAVLADIDMGAITWSKCPLHVASDVIDYVNRIEAIESLLNAITHYEAKHKT